jgi:prolyl-tRNA editing enzyme YbaK/EbsC (Cys-tRNA(Pro) deacylase)
MQQFGSDKFDLRTEADKKNNVLAFAWVIDFPFFEKVKIEDGSASRSLGEGWTFTHNPFSQPRPKHREWLLKKKNIDQIVADQYDIVCNGYEVGGGSIRGSSPEILRSVFEIMGYEKSRIDQEFGHMLQALALGAPPHGGLAHGIERLLMILAREEYLREVVAFPQTSTGSTSVMDAPSEVSKLQLEELGIVFDIKEVSVFDEIVAFLTRKKIDFTVSEHKHVKTSEEAAAIRGVALSTGAKALVMYGDTKPMMVVVSGDKKIDMKRFKDLYSIKDLRMATPEEVKKVTHVEIGAVPPFGHIFSIPIYIDASILNQETIYFNPGLHTKTIAMTSANYLVAANGVRGNFSK